MKTSKFLISLILILLGTLFSAGCNSDGDNQESNDQVVDDTADEPQDSTSADVDNCASRTFINPGGTFVLFGGATLTELAPVEDGIQVFTLATGNSDCGLDTASGMLVQSSTAVDNLSFFLNGAQISLGSTVFFQAPRNDDDENINVNSMKVKTIEGAAITRIDGETTTIIAGTQVTVPLNDALQASGPPSELQPYQNIEEEVLPIELLEYEIDYSEPLSDEELALFNEYEVLFDGIEVQDVDELFGYLNEQGGEDIPEFLINELGYTGFDEDVEDYLQDDLGYDLEGYDGYTGEVTAEEGGESEGNEEGDEDSESVVGEEGDDGGSETEDDEEGDGD